LFTKQAKFLLLPSRSFMLRFSWPVGLPDGTSPPAIEHGRVKLETHDVPAFVTEDHMPPERELMYRIDFIYNSSDNQEKEPVAYWKKVGKENFHEINRFVDKRRVMEQAVAQIVAPATARKSSCASSTSVLNKFAIYRSSAVSPTKRKSAKIRRTRATSATCGSAATATERSSRGCSLLWLARPASRPIPCWSPLATPIFSTSAS